MRYKVKYYKHTNPNRDTAVMKMRGGEGYPKVTIWLDPILKRKGNKTIKNGIIRHELDEHRGIVKGMGEMEAHRYARNKEKPTTKKIATHKRFWEHMNKKYDLGIVWVSNKKK